MLCSSALRSTVNRPPEPRDSSKHLGPGILISNDYVAKISNPLSGETVFFKLYIYRQSLKPDHGAILGAWPKEGLATAKDNDATLLRHTAKGWRTSIDFASLAQELESFRNFMHKIKMFYAYMV